LKTCKNCGFYCGVYNKDTCYCPKTCENKNQWKPGLEIYEKAWEKLIRDEGSILNGNCPPEIECCYTNGTCTNCIIDYVMNKTIEEMEE